MSTGKSAAKRAESRALEAAGEDRARRVQVESKLQKERERAQRLFIRQARARQGGGFFGGASETRDTLG